MSIKSCKDIMGSHLVLPFLGSLVAGSLDLKHSDVGVFWCDGTIAVPSTLGQLGSIKLEKGNEI